MFVVCYPHFSELVSLPRQLVTKWPVLLTLNSNQTDKHLFRFRFNWGSYQRYCARLSNSGTVKAVNEIWTIETVCHKQQWSWIVPEMVIQSRTIKIKYWNYTLALPISVVGQACVHISRFNLTCVHIMQWNWMDVFVWWGTIAVAQKRWLRTVASCHPTSWAQLWKSRHHQSRTRRQSSWTGASQCC